MPVNLNSIGLGALLSAQSALATTGHNIANAGTPGYSRQRLELSATSALVEGGHSFGQGVQINGVNRIVDAVVEGQIETQRANLAQARELGLFSSRVDTMMSDGDIGVGASIEGFFGALRELGDNPAGTVERELLLDSGEAVADRVQSAIRPSRRIGR